MDGTALVLLVLLVVALVFNSRAAIVRGLGRVPVLTRRSER